MNHLRNEIQELNQAVTDYHQVATPEAIEAAEEKRGEAEPELSTLVRPNAFEEHLNAFLTQERKRLEDGDRDEPLCDCARPTCPLKNESLPPQVLGAESLETGIRRYEREHVGSAKVLEEGRRDFAETCGEVKAILRAAVGLVRKTDFGDEEEEDETEAEAVA